MRCVRPSSASVGRWTEAKLVDSRPSMISHSRDWDSWALQRWGMLDYSAVNRTATNAIVPTSRSNKPT